ncbi:unnamed protein product [Brassica oleracea var. botrytis]|uniref:Uncharacterized protein n=1 Tax=Brassica oleracea TaxID=3712 RepID=A0A3P6FTP4_BRAOL|nr:unnamed protein product [Brassica oleracea]
MIQLKDKKKKVLLGGVEGSSSHFPELSIHSRDSFIEMNLIINVHLKRFMILVLMIIFEGEGELKL